MDRFEPAQQYRIADQLSVIRLTLQVAERWGGLSEQHRSLLQTALEATTALTVELLDLAPHATLTTMIRTDAADGAIAEAVRRYAARDGQTDGRDDEHSRHHRGDRSGPGAVEVPRGGLRG
jgi:hypothetical protein